jgi:hypothetical protein
MSLFLSQQLFLQKIQMPLSTIFIKEFKKPPLKNNPGEWGHGTTRLYTSTLFIWEFRKKAPA